MPLYEYECTQCKRHTEKIQKFSDAEITECPHCGGKLERVISAPAISFKGGGWFADGYGNAKPKASEGKSDGKSGGDSGAAKSESGGSPGSSSSSKEPAPASTPTSGATASSAPAAPASSPTSSSDKK
jgi:putative FmdB family regulatory protein